MTLHFGLDFDGIVHLPPAAVKAGELFLGPKKLLGWLETHLGLSGYPENSDYLRIELYRQALSHHAEDTFFAASFAADRFACSATLLAWRDELLLGGWDFQEKNDCPPRLCTLAQVETAFQKKLADPEIGARAFGWADRFHQVLSALSEQNPGPLEIVLYEAEHLQLPHILRLLSVFRSKNIPVHPRQEPFVAHPSSRLGRLQQRLTGVPESHSEAVLTNDDSLIILKSRRDSDAAVAVAQLLERNPEFRPLLFVPELDRALEHAMVLEQFPAMGILSASLARPSLQVLKLAPAFLWDPIDVFKIMEFVTLSVKPLDDGLALEIARVLAEKPGLFSDTWFAAVYGYLEQGELPAETRRQYEFWFDRRRYRSNTTAPVRDAIGIYAFLHTWALQYFDKTGSKNNSLLVLAEQARRIRDLLEALPEQRLSYLELERIVRTIYEPSPMQLGPAEAGRFEFIHQPGAMATTTERLLWWNCLFTDPTPPPDKWQTAERQWLELQSVVLDSPKAQSQRGILRQQNPVLKTSRQLVLVVPDQTNGSDAVPSLLLGDIEATFGDCRAFTFHLDDEPDRRRLSEIWNLPDQEILNSRPLHRTPPFLEISQPEKIPESEYETLTNLESLFYYPHRWFFRQKMKLYPASLLSVTSDTTLLGSLAHRFFELLLQENLNGLDKSAIGEWVDQQAPSLLNREGATLLLYGREPERNAFLSKVKNAAWSLVSILRANQWEVEGTEIELFGEIAGVPVRGKADLVLRRGDHERAIVDLKWSGSNRRREMIRNGEDLQLVLYSRLLPPAEQWAHSAYFILEEGKMIARNRAAFSDALVPAGSDADHIAACEAIFSKMEKTFLWRMEQIRTGRLELRTAHNAVELEGLYANEALFELLEMKNEDARWDDYSTLLQYRSGV